MTDVARTSHPALPREAAPETPLPLRDHPLVLAVDASAPGAAAARVAAALGATRGAIPHAVHAFDTSGVPMPGPLPALMAAADALIGPEVHAPDVRVIHEQLGSQIGRAVDWPVHVGLGTPAGLVVRTAAALHAALIVMGLRRHGVLDRVLRDGTTLDVMRTASCPVLGVTPALTGPPRTVVVGIDFGPAARRAARVALDLLADGGALVLAYVAPIHGDGDTEEEVDGDGSEHTALYALGVDAAFARLETDLLVPAAVVVRHARVVGRSGESVAEALLAVAARCEADLLAVGSRRHHWIDRLLLGSVAAELARDGRQALLVVPPPPAPPPTRLDA